MKKAKENNEAADQALMAEDEESSAEKSRLGSSEDGSSSPKSAVDGADDNVDRGHTQLQPGGDGRNKEGNQSLASSHGRPRANSMPSQPAGESPLLSLGKDGSKAASGDGRLKARTQSEATLTSYEDLERSVKDRRKALDASTFKKAAKSGSSKVVPDNVVMMIMPEEPHGPPKIITTTSSVGSGSGSGSGSASPSSQTKKSSSTLRRGKWTVEEEAYVARVIQDFNSGFLDAPAGTTLRTYLSEKLQCDPMRITKKFTGDACIGKRVFHPAVRSPSNAAAIDKAQSELDNLEKRWRRRLEMQQRETAKKAAASAAAVAVGRVGPSTDTSARPANENVVTRTASWLDRAKSVLQEAPQESQIYDDTVDLQSQMQEVQRLIHEGPMIQQTSAGLPEMIDRAEQQARAVATAVAEVEPADKRMRTAEDAEALVGFLRSVRASAASGQEF